MDPLTISYKNNGSYPVIIENNYGKLAEMISGMFPNLQRICIVTDSNVAPLYLDAVRSYVSE